MIIGVSTDGSQIVAARPRERRTYHPPFRTASFVTVRTVRASEPYGHDVAASGYRFEDRNGFSVAILRDAARDENRYASKRDKREARKVADRAARKRERDAITAERARVAQAERCLAGTIGNIE